MTPNLPVLGISTFEDLFEGDTRTSFEERVLPAYLCRQRWFGSKARIIASARLRDGGPLQPPDTPFLAIVHVLFEDGGEERYAVPLTMLTGLAAERLLSTTPASAVAWLDRAGGRLLIDAMMHDSACRGLLESIGARPEYPLARGTVLARRDVPASVDERQEAERVRRTGAEQSNSSVVFGTAAILKLYRRLEAGVHPEIELGRFLRGHDFRDVPELLGSLEYDDGAEPAALAVLHRLVPNATDGWVHALQHLADYYERVGAALVAKARRIVPHGSVVEMASRGLSQETVDAIGSYLEPARILGEQTGRLHQTLARGTTASFAPEPLTRGDIVNVVDGTRARARRAFARLASLRSGATAAARTAMDALAGRETTIFSWLDELEHTEIDATRTRCHQDYHLGQLLWAGSRYAMLDFEGEPARSLAERRAKRSPLTDVAGMLRSYSYAAWSGLFAWCEQRKRDPVEHQPWALLWEHGVAATFLNAYLETTRGQSFVPGDERQRNRLLSLLVLDKALYELEYEMNNRPAWLQVPLEGLLQLTE